jgi:hypothetical protein
VCVQRELPLRAASARMEAIQRLVKGMAVVLVFGTLLLVWLLVVTVGTVRQSVHMDASDGYLTVVVQGCDVVRQLTLPLDQSPWLPIALKAAETEKKLPSGAMTLLQLLGTTRRLLRQVLGAADALAPCREWSGAAWLSNGCCAHTHSPRPTTLSPLRPIHLAVSRSHHAIGGAAAASLVVWRRMLTALVT